MSREIIHLEWSPLPPIRIKDIGVPDLVECHSGYEYAERPIALFWESQRLEVAEVLQRWRTPGNICFRVITTDEKSFDLSYDEHADVWYIEPV